MARLSDRGFVSTRGLSLTREGTAQAIDALLPLTHGLGSVPNSLELWVEASAGNWEQHDASAYILSTATQLVTTGTTLASVLGGATNVRLVAAAGAVALSVAEASASQAGIVSTGTQTFAGAKTFSSTIVGDISGNAATVTNGVYTTGAQTIAGAKTFSESVYLATSSGNVGIGTASPLAKLQTNAYAQYDYIAGTDERLAVFAPTSTGASSSAQVILGNAIYRTGGTESLRLSFLNNHANGSLHTGWAFHSYNNLDNSTPIATFSLETIKRPSLNTDPPVRTSVLQISQTGAVTLGPSGGVGSVSVPNNTPTTLIDVGSTEYQNRQIWLVVYDTGTNVGAAAFIYVNFQGAVYTPTINQTFTGTNTSLLSVSGTQIRFTQTFGSTRTIRYRMVAL